MKALKILALFLTFQIQVFSQENWINYDFADELFPTGTQSIESDYSNNIWIRTGGGSTGDGLIKFDGTNWTHFDTNNSDISSNSIKAMKSDMNGNLWICFFSGIEDNEKKLTKFDGQIWEAYDTTNSDIISGYISDIQIDINNNVWMSGLNGFSKFDGISFTNFPLNLKPYKFLIEDANSIWFIYSSDYGDGLGNYNPITNTIIDTFNINNSNLPSYSISCLDQDSQGRIWLGFDFAFNGGIGNGGSNGGIAIYDGTEFIPIMPFSDSYDQVMALEIDENDNVWVSMRCGGLYKFDGQNWEQVQGIPLNGCLHDVTIDKLGNIWCGELYTGLWTNKSEVVGIEIVDTEVFEVSPNPVNDYFHITHNFKQQVEFKLYNSFGIPVLYKFIDPETSNVSISQNHFNSGIYFWKVFKNNNLIKSGKMIVVKN